MCRNIKTLFNFEPPATNEEIHAASLQFVRKISGSTKPSRVNRQVFDQAVTDVAKVVHNLLQNLDTQAAPKNRDVEAAKARARVVRRFANQADPGQTVI